MLSLIKTSLVSIISFLPFSNAMAICQIPSDLETPISENQRWSCLNDSYFLKTPITTITPEKAIQGPPIKALGFKGDEKLFCRFFYVQQGGSSNKFRCYRTNEKNELMNRKGDTVAEATHVGAPDSPNHDLLLDSNENPVIGKDGQPMKADVLKVRFQDGSKRNRENYASSAATRFSWIMGFSTENYFPVEKVSCFGCDKDPWKSGLNPQKQELPNTLKDFNYAAIERTNEARIVMKGFTSEDKKINIIAWSWIDYVSKFNQLSDSQKKELQVMALFANFFQTVENTGQQHVMFCEDEFLDNSNNTCLKPLAATHDMGASFGNRDKKWIDPQNKNHPRADYQAYAATEMFKPNSCDLVSVPGGLKSVNETARQEFVRRLELLTPEVIIAVLRNSHFQFADLVFRQQIAISEKLTGSALDERILELWTELILNKINIFTSARCQP